MNPTVLYVSKLVLVALVILGGIVLAALGKIDATAMFSQIATVVGALVVALGISAGGTAVGGQLRAASTSPRQ